MKNTQVVPAEFLTIIFFFYLKPFPDLFLMPDIIAFCLHISPIEGIFFRMKKLFIHSGHVTAMGQIVSGISDIDPVFPLVITFHLFLRNFFSIVQIHKIQATAAMHIVGHGFTSHDSPVHAMIQSHTAQGNIAEQLVSQSVTCPNFRSYHNDVSTIFSFSTL